MEFGISVDIHFAKVSVMLASNLVMFNLNLQGFKMGG